jgi:hypothetical protein
MIVMLMFIKYLVRWRQWCHYSVTSKDRVCTLWRLILLSRWSKRQKQSESRPISIIYFCLPWLLESSIPVNFYMQHPLSPRHVIHQLARASTWMEILAKIILHSNLASVSYTVCQFAQSPTIYSLGMKI